MKSMYAFDDTYGLSVLVFLAEKSVEAAEEASQSGYTMFYRRFGLAKVEVA